MNKLKLLSLVSIFALAACGQDQPVTAEDVAAADKTAVEKKKPASQWDGTVVKPAAPFQVDYRVIGTPVVGAPVSIDVRVTSTLGPQVVNLSYRIPDETSMRLHEAQPAEMVAEFATNQEFADERITVVPQREGRLYLNVGASIDTASGRSSMTIAIPLQVGAGARIMEEEGELATDEDGEAIRILTSE